MSAADAQPSVVPRRRPGPSSESDWTPAFAGGQQGVACAYCCLPALRLHPASFVNFTQNHDQIANSGRGLRCHLLAGPGRHRAVTALLLLMPGTPMLFMGQEFCSTAPFLYFADHDPDLARLVREGRADSLRQFRSVATPQAAYMNVR